MLSCWLVVPYHVFGIATVTLLSFLEIPGTINVTDIASLCSSSPHNPHNQGNEGEQTTEQILHANTLTR